MPPTLEELLTLDRELIWHPYTQHGLTPDVLPVSRAQGAYLELSTGEKLLDGISSWWVNLHGHAHPLIAQAIAEQAKKLEHVLFAGFTHEPAILLAQKLTSHPALRAARLSRVFFSDNGSTAVEAALKIAYQFFRNQKHPRRGRFLALRDAYHGDTLGAMAVGEPEGFHSSFRKLMPPVDFFAPGKIEELERLLSERAEDYAALIVEPLLQGAGGMKQHSAEFLDECVRLCRKAGILVIFDEVFTGFYRTGRCFAFEHARETPDLICLSKGITGGFLPLGATLATPALFEGFSSREMREAFLHGHSYTANPLACAAAVASWRILHEESTLKKIQAISLITEKRIQSLSQNPRVKRAVSLGTIGAIELDLKIDYFSAGKSIWKEVFNRARARGVLLRPLGNVLYTVPPYCVQEDEMEKIYGVFEEILEAFAS